MDKLRTYAAREWKYYLLAAGFSLVLCLLCLPVGAVDCINYDSSYQYALTRHSLPEIWALIPADYSPPLYTLLLKAFTLIAGDSLFFLTVPQGLTGRRPFPLSGGLVCSETALCAAFPYSSGRSSLTTTCWSRPRSGMATIIRCPTGGARKHHQKYFFPW